VNRIFGQYFSAEMAVLCLIEWALNSVIIYALLMFAAAPDAPLAHAGAGNLSVLLALTIGAIAVTIGLYRPEICLARGRLLVNAGVAGVLAFPALLVVSETLDVALSGGYLLWLAKGLIAWVLCLLFTRWVFSFAMRNRLFMRRVLVLGSGHEATRIREQIQSHHGSFFEIVNPALPLDAEGTANRGSADWVIGTRKNRIWGIVVATPEDGAKSGKSECLTAPALLDLKLRGVRIFDELSFCEQHLGRINLDRVDVRWLIFADGFSRTRLGDVLKRLADLVISMAVLCLTLPLMLVTALLIKLDSPGPIFYRQERVGLHGRTFTLFKFRSMALDAEAGGRPRWASQKDSRITRVGAFIRSTRIDELPQLLNVLGGEMSFVGPRPERPHFVEQLAQVIPFYRERSYVKPGITGWAQVNFPYGASVEDARQKLSYDLYYVKNRSLLLDIIILFSTIRVILFREGAR
jgi:sugar transferase (PEP-CTERM system associated)